MGSVYRALHSPPELPGKASGIPSPFLGDREGSRAPQTIMESARAITPLLIEKLFLPEIGGRNSPKGLKVHLGSARPTLKVGAERNWQLAPLIQDETFVRDLRLKPFTMTTCFYFPALQDWAVPTWLAFLLSRPRVLDRRLLSGERGCGEEWILSK